jgi:hypothetical protein
MFTRNFNCPRCGTENSEVTLECSNCGLKFANMDYDRSEVKKFYFYNEKAYQKDLEKMGYDISSRKINKNYFIILLLPLFLS